MNLAKMLTKASDFVSTMPPAVTNGTNQALKTAETTADALGDRAETARHAMSGTAAKAQKFTWANLVTAYDAASRLLPMLVPERASRVRNRRIVYAAMGGVALGAATIAIVEVARPGTLATFATKIRRLTGQAANGAKADLEQVKEAVTTAAGQAKNAVTHAAAEVKGDAAQAAGAMKGAAQTFGTRIAEVSQDASRQGTHDFEVAKDKVTQAVDASNHYPRRVPGPGNQRS